VAHKTNLLERVQDQLDTLYAGVFDAMDRFRPGRLWKGTAAARAAGADLLMRLEAGASSWGHASSPSC
jgi:hypothetical protein